jgi:hypothetical protein
VMRFRKRAGGQALILICFSSTVLFALLGLVVDVGWMYWRKEAALSAAQAGALAGAAKISSLTSITCSTTGVFCNTTPQQCPANGATDNSGTACDYANANFFNPSNANQNVTVAANTGTAPTASGTSSSYYITVRVTEKRSLSFLSVLNVTLGYVSARATAGVFTTASGACVYILDPTGQASLDASNDAQITSSCGIWDYSSASNGLYAVGSANVTATSGEIQYNGGSYTDNSGSRFSPAPVYQSPSGNPLSSIVLPWSNCLNPATGASTTCPSTTCQYTGCSGSSTHCDYTTTSSTYSSYVGMYQLNPGIYCGDGIQISNGNGAFFAPGIYVINGFGVSLNGSNNYCVGVGSCSASGGGVIFYLTGTDANYAGFVLGNGSRATLSAPTSGDLEGLLIYSDPGITAPTTAASSACNQYDPPTYAGLSNGATAFCGGASSNLSGIIYLPNTTAAFTNGTGTGGVLSLVVKDAVFNGGSSYFGNVTGGVLQSAATGSVKTSLIE